MQPTDRPPDLLSLSEPAAYVTRTPWPPLSAFIATVAILAMGFFAAVVVGSVLRSLGVIVDRPLVGDSAVSLSRWLATLLSFQAAIVLATLWAAERLGGEARNVLALRPPAQGTGMYLGGMVLTLITAGVLTIIGLFVSPDSLRSDMQAFAGLARADQWWLTLVVIVIGAPLAEELLFRGFLFAALMRTRLGFAGSAVLSSTAWAALHVGYSAFSLSTIFFIGLLFSFLLWRTGSLRVPLACHAAYNFVVLLLIRAGVLPV